MTPAVRPVLAALLAGIALAACSRQPPAAAAHPPAVVTVAKPLVKRIVEWDRYTGRLAAVESVEVRARVSGYLASTHFSEGQEVERGQVLAVIDPRPFQLAVDQARARVEEARAETRRVRANVEQAEAAARRSEALAALATRQLERAKTAAETNAIAREQVDVRESEVVQARAAVESARAAVASAVADATHAEAAVTTAEATLAIAELDLSYTRVTAPISGRISRRFVTKGNLVEGGNVASTLLTTIVSLDPIHVYFDANEQAFLKYVRLANAGRRRSSREAKNPLFLQLVDEIGYPHRGHMDFVDNQVDANTGTMRGRGILRNPDGLLTPGLFARVFIPGGEPRDAVMIPDEAVLANQAQRFVYVIGAENLPEIRPIELGPIIDGLRVVRSGLAAEDRVVIAGTQWIRPGAPVAPQPGEIVAKPSADALPDHYEPVPEAEWIQARPAAAPEEGR
ncbi:MAG: efflux RND transporter periplasmic adaptor subunit [Planctomycetota bacterium]